MKCKIEINILTAPKPAYSCVSSVVVNQMCSVPTSHIDILYVYIVIHIFIDTNSFDG